MVMTRMEKKTSTMAMKAPNRARKSRQERQKSKAKRPLRRRRPNLKIEDVLKVGQHLMVQITKGIGNKAPW